MNIYKEASKRNLRFATSHGSKDIITLWEVDQESLKKLKERLERKIVSGKDPDDKLRYEIVSDILESYHCLINERNI